MTLSYPPPWQDLVTLAAHLCCGESTVEKWVREGRLPAPRLIGGKRMWRWVEVDEMLSQRNDLIQDVERIRDATRRAAGDR